MNSSRTIFALFASISLVSAAPGLLGGLGLADTIGEAEGGLGGIIGQQGGLGAILAQDSGNNGQVEGVTGEVLPPGHGNIGGLLEKVLTTEGGLGGLLDLVNQPGLETTIRPLLSEVFKIVSGLADRIEEVLARLQDVLNQLSTTINNPNLTDDEKNQEIKSLVQNSPVEMNTILYIASQLAKTSENGEVLPTPAITPF